MADKKYINQVFEACKALSDLTQRYPWIKPSDIDFFSPVYYPIAIIEMDFDEQSFEDFEIVQLSVLRFVDLGITSPDIISTSMGINNPNYIYNVLQLLKSYGLIGNSGITDLGRSSLKEEKKISLSRVKQQFQLDALNGNLLRIDQNLISSSLISSNETIAIIGHLDYLDGVPSEYVEKQIRNVGFNHFKKYRSSILNANVMAIYDIRCVEIQYTKCYLLKLNSAKIPIVFGKRYNAVSNMEKDRFFWQPLSYDHTSPTFSKNLASEDIPNNSEAATTYISQLVLMLKERSANVDFVEEVKKALHKWNNGLSVSDSQISFHPANSHRCATVKIDHTNFIKFNGVLLSYFDAIIRNEEFLITSPRLYGNIISIITNDKYIHYTTVAYRELRKKVDAATIAKKTREYINQNSLENLQGEDLLKSLFSFFRKMNSLL